MKHSKKIKLVDGCKLQLHKELSHQQKKSAHNIEKDDEFKWFLQWLD